ncbi:peroxisomal membrane protein 4 [Trypanosoma theileri]|uniref:Peroxisomal membrane protein 4 n=1 Tax=Trypanosoma theileri TaxID=67003 RepID=A0A1X0P776_9TRYP|nr:peroxisomal membrane protein 4 [Trypanosoma theileri]ORC92806.1 peroxisomal membrane protein 4 [Trypanosoma theileri]
MSSTSPAAPPPAAALRLVDDMIRSGRYKLLLDAVKGFRNGFVYGARIRAPHALVLNIVWTHAPLAVILRRVFTATRRHAVALGATGLTVSLLRGLLARLEGGQRVWHSALAGFIVGCAFWGEQTPVAVQMALYILSRIISAGVCILAERHNIKLTPTAFRLCSGVLWMIVMPLFFFHGEALQPSMRTSMKYIYQDNEKYTSWYDLICVNSETSF